MASLDVHEWSIGSPFEPMASGPTALINTQRRENGTGNILKLAGVDMTTPQPIEDTMHLFGDLVTQFERLHGAS
jgi:hypothetical protein